MKIIIAGGGLGGLLLAHKLVKEGASVGIEVVVLERDVAPNARGQGIVIGLAQPGVDCINGVGLGSILEGLMSDKGPRHVALRSVGGTTTIFGRNWMRVTLWNKKKVSCLIPRADLRNTMANMLPEGIIRWNSKVVKVEDRENKVIVTLADGTNIEGDVLVGADGARSAIREQCFPNLVPDVLDIYNCWGTMSAAKFGDFGSKGKLLEDAKIALTRTNGLNGFSMLVFVYYTNAASNEAALLWSLSFPKSRFLELVNHPDMPSEQLRARLVEILQSHFDEPAIAHMVQISDEVNAGYSLSSVKPTLYSSGRVCDEKNSKARITLLGDAAHKTTTQAGLGATAAFQDAIDLGTTIIAKGQELSAFDLRDYEKRMCARAKMVVGASLGNTNIIHVERGRVGSTLTTGFMWTVGGIMSLVGFARSLLFWDW